MSEIINKVVTKHEITGQVKVTKVYPELENLTVTPTKTVQSFEHPGCYGYNNVVVKAIDCEPLSVVPQKEDQNFDGMYDKVTVKAIKCSTLNVVPKQESQAFDGMYDKVNVDAIVSDTLEITPTKSSQSFKGLYDQVNVGAIQGSTLNVAPKQESQTFNGLYETVNVEEMHGDTLDITPTEATQTFGGIYENVNVGAIETEEVTVTPDFSSQDIFEVTPTEGKYISKAIVNKDPSLVPENIIKGNSIYGVEGIREIEEGGIDTSDATATAEDIAQDKTAYVNGEKVVGNVEVVEESSRFFTTNVFDFGGSVSFQNIFTIPQLFRKNSKLLASANNEDIAKAIKLNSEQIVEGNTVLGVNGTAKLGTDTSDATATAGDIASGKTAYVKGKKVVGNLDIKYTSEKLSTDTITLLTEGIYVGSDASSTTLIEKNWLKTSKNLFNKNDGIVKGFYLNSEGGIGEDEFLYYQETYIPVYPNRTYTNSVFSEGNYPTFRICEYDINKNFIRRLLCQPETSENPSRHYSFTTSSNCHYLRLSFYWSDIDVMQLTMGSALDYFYEYTEPKLYRINANNEYVEVTQE